MPSGPPAARGGHSAPRGGKGLAEWRRDAPTLGQQLAVVVEDYDAVAQQAPPLLGVAGDRVCGGVLPAVRQRTGHLVTAVVEHLHHSTCVRDPKS